LIFDVVSNFDMERWIACFAGDDDNRDF